MTITLDTLTLPDELMWVDEFAWGTVRFNAKRTVLGRLVLLGNNVMGNSGRLITLESDNSWILRSDLLILRNWTDEIDKDMVLKLHDGTLFSCRFRFWDTPCIEASPIVSTAFPTNDTYYKLTLKLVVV